MRILLKKTVETFFMFAPITPPNSPYASTQDPSTDLQTQGTDSPPGSPSRKSSPFLDTIKPYHSRTSNPKIDGVQPEQKRPRIVSRDIFEASVATSPGMPEESIASAILDASSSPSRRRVPVRKLDLSPSSTPPRNHALEGIASGESARPWSAPSGERIVRYNPPPTPVRKGRQSSRRVSAIPFGDQNFEPVLNYAAAPVMRSVNPYNELYRTVRKGELRLNNVPVQVVRCGAGDFMEVFSITADVPIWRGIDNQNLVLKMYGVKSSFKEERLDSFLSSSMNSYLMLRGLLEGKIATIYNFASAKEDHYVLQEKIPHEISVEAENQVQQVREFFITSLTHKVALDLKPDNLRVREDGTVVLIDFVEDDSDGLRVFIRHSLRAWARAWKDDRCDREAVAARLESLTAGLVDLGLDPTVNAEIIDELFMQVRVIGM